uniref:ABC-type glutathione-S-conjugate transporter n=1 Tax=Tigriopus japonicus TaxID=158387 RepID=A0A0A7ARL6_TIGJA|nr:ATP-binding cassette transporter sub-family C member 1 isoform X4 [Tigriopus japonicus]
MKFCNTPFWDINQTWNTEEPDFPLCFHQTVLVYVPCLFLWLLTPVELCWINSSQSRNVLWNPINIAKFLCIGVCLILDLINLSFILVQLGTSSDIVAISDVLRSLILVCTLGLALTLTFLNKRMGLTTSAILFLFWWLLVLCFSPTFASVIRFGAIATPRPMWNMEQSVIYTFYYAFLVATAFLNCWADPPPTYWQIEKQVETPSPELFASFPSKVLFSWMNGLFKMGWKTPLNGNNMYDLKPDLMSRFLTKRWNRLKKFKMDPVAYEPKVSIYKTLGRSFWLSFLWATFFQVLTLILNQLSPQILSLLISYTTSSEPEWKGYLYMTLMVVVNMLKTLTLSHNFFMFTVIGQNVRTMLISAIYEKTFLLSSSSRRQRSVGETVNLMSIDSERVSTIIGSLNTIWYSPTVIILSLAFLWEYVGPSCLAGLGVMIILIPVNAILSAKIKKYQVINMRKKDARLEVMNEILDGIKVMKLYAWEPSFAQKVSKVRDEEVETLKKISYLGAVQTLLFNSAVFLVTLATFATYVLVDPSNILDAQKAFVSISYFNLMRVPLNQLPMLIIQAIQALVSHKRLDSFLNAPEIDEDAITNDPDNKVAIHIQDGSFAWDHDSSLQNINLKVKRGSLVAIVGQVGSGKSSLISAILGDMQKISGSVNVDGSVAYVPQQAWIQNASVRDNITFGREYFENIYKEAVKACALEEDFLILDDGDQTEIGEKGINLSGGQKQRVSLARAVYNNRDIYLFDDPLSAVDAHVGNHIFREVMSSRTGVLRNKTRVLVTHSLSVLSEVDMIIVLKNGTITEMGTYEELVSSQGAFSFFLAEYGTTLPQSLNEVEGMETFKETIDTIMLRNKNGPKHSPLTHQDEPTHVIFGQKKRRNSASSGTMGNALSLRKRKVSHDSKTKPSTERPKRKPKISRKKKLIVEEKLETKAVSIEVYLYYARAIGICVTFSILLLYAVNQGFSVGTNVWLAKWSDDPNSAIPSIRNLYLGIYGLLGGASAVTIMVVYLIVTIGGLNASTKLHNNILTTVLAAPMMFFDTNPKGRVLNRFSKDVDAVDSSVPGNFNGFFKFLFNTCGTIAIICFTNPIFIAIFIPLFVCYYFIQKVYIATSRQIKRLNSIARSPIYSLFGETLSGVVTIKAFKLQGNFIEQNHGMVDNFMASNYLNFAANRWLSIRLEMLGNVVILFASLFAVLGKDVMNPGVVGLSLSYAMQITGSLNFLIRLVSQIENNMVSVERIQEYEMDVDQEASYALVTDPSDGKTWPPQGAIRFQDYKTRYRPGLDLVLRGVTCDIEAGEKVGIVGRTGAGKSSLTMALFRMIEPASGSIFIDGVNICSLGLGFLRSHITIIPQDPVLFSGSMRQNLDPFGHFSDPDIWKALELSHLGQYVSSLKMGLDHEIAEGGSNLSVGQKQLVCLARALLRKTQILILDEATAAVDLETDDLIQTTIRKEFSECTILTIAHRLNTIMDCDKIIVLSNGIIAEMGSPSILLQDQRSIFYDMAQNAGLVYTSFTN